jgi:hypothetical protein
MSEHLTPIRNEVAPQKLGKWWARQRGVHFWNLIVQISGRAPYFEITITNLLTLTKTRGYLSDVQEWGPEIIITIEPVVEPQEKRI